MSQKSVKLVLYCRYRVQDVYQALLLPEYRLYSHASVLGLYSYQDRMEYILVNRRVQWFWLRKGIISWPHGNENMNRIEVSGNQWILWSLKRGKQ